MAAVPVTLNGVMYPKGKTADDKPVPCVFVGTAWITGLRPSIDPPVPPVEPPIDQPPPDRPLDDLLTSVAKEPPPQGGWAFFPEYGWLYSPGPSGPQPKK